MQTPDQKLLQVIIPLYQETGTDLIKILSYYLSLLSKD